MPITDEQFETLAQDVRKLTSEVIRYTTITQRHIAEEERINRHMDRMIADHEARLRSLEEWKAGSEPRLPDRLLNADKIEKDIETLQGDVGSIKEKLAKYGGAVVVTWALAQVIVVPLIQALWKYLIGS